MGKKKGALRLSLPILAIGANKKQGETDVDVYTLTLFSVKGFAVSPGRPLFFCHQY